MSKTIQLFLLVLTSPVYMFSFAWRIARAAWVDGHIDARRLLEWIHK